MAPSSVLTVIGLLSIIINHPVLAFWRLPCTAPIVVERADPIVDPGAVSGHVHSIMGGNGFGFTMDYASTQASTCSSCTVEGDFSNYWVPSLYYQHQNGSFEKVGQTGGATVYYLQRGDAGEQLYAFPEGFRMIAGDPYKRANGSDFASQAISYACLDYNTPPTPETPNFPSTNCPDGLRAQVFFPSCWDGVNLDSADHKSHVSYPSNEYNYGPCPSDYPKHLISLFYETTWNVNDFADMWYGDSQPFVWSQGDPTGYGFHGDFLNGWNVSLLQSAVDECTNLSGTIQDCPVFDITPNNIAEGCIIAPQVDEQVSGMLDALPGCNPVQEGPGEAVPQSGCGATTQISAAASFFTDLTSLGWSYIGCGTDNYFDRILTGPNTSGNNMTNANCVEFCSSQGYIVAGTEYSSQCGNSIPSSGAPVPGVIGNCQMVCTGDSSEYCGGTGAISLYQKCTGSTCVNAQIGPDDSSAMQSISAVPAPTLKGTPMSSVNPVSVPTLKGTPIYSIPLISIPTLKGTPIYSEPSISTPTLKGTPIFSAPSTPVPILKGTPVSSVAPVSVPTLKGTPIFSEPPISIPTLKGTPIFSELSMSVPTLKGTPIFSQPSIPIPTLKGTPIYSEPPTSVPTLKGTPIFCKPPVSIPTLKGTPIIPTTMSTVVKPGSSSAPNVSGTLLSSISFAAAESSTSGVLGIGPWPSSTSTASSSNSKISLPAGWDYLGCYSDNLNPRSLVYWSNFDGTIMASTACVEYCAEQGFSFAGTEWGSQCFCGNVLSNSEKTPESECTMTCDGDVSQICGGPARLSLFTDNSEASPSR